MSVNLGHFPSLVPASLSSASLTYSQFTIFSCTFLGIAGRPFPITPSALLYDHLSLGRSKLSQAVLDFSPVAEAIVVAAVFALVIRGSAEACATGKFAEVRMC